MSLADAYNGIAAGFACVGLFNFLIVRKRGLRSVALGISSLLMAGVSFLLGRGAWIFGLVVLVFAAIFFFVARSFEIVEKQH